MQQSITAMYDQLPRLVRILLQIFLGGVIGGIYRVLRYLETKNIVTLVIGILSLVTGVGNFILWLADLSTMVTQDKITLFVD